MTTLEEEKAVGDTIRGMGVVDVLAIGGTRSGGVEVEERDDGRVRAMMKCVALYASYMGRGKG